MEALTATATAAVVSAVAGLAAMRLGPRLGFLDRPDADLKVHEGSVVPLGGVGVLMGTAGGLFLLELAPPWPVGLAAIMVWLLGLLDDRWSLSPVGRLAGEVAAGVLAGLGFRDHGVVFVVVLAGATVVAVNAVNLFDGLDALAGSVGVVSFLGLALLGGLRQQPEWTAALATAGALVGFLLWNRPPARLFLGDNGAYLTGLALVYVAAAISDSLVELLVALTLVGVPLLDLAVTVLRRARRRRPLFQGDRDHTYDRVHQGGWRVGKVSRVFASLQAGWVAVVIGTEAVSPTLALVAACVVGLAVVAAGLVWVPSSGRPAQR